MVYIARQNFLYKLVDFCVEPGTRRKFYFSISTSWPFSILMSFTLGGSLS